MKGIVFTGNSECVVREFPTPEPGHGEVLLRIMATGICGSDLSEYRRESAIDQIRGHEPAGVVEAVGEGVKRVKPGDRVSVHHHQGCGVCDSCARGETVACPEDRVVGVSTGGSFAEFTVVDERNCIPLADSVSFIDGAFMACVGGTAWGAYTRLEVKPCDSVVVFGLGPVGLSCVLVGKALGLRVIGVDVAAERVAFAQDACGSDAGVDASEADCVAAVHEFTGRGADNVIETSGAASARRNIIPSLRRGGKAAIVGVGSTEAVINPSDIHGKACTIIGSVVFPLGWMWDLSRFIGLSGMSFEPAVTHRLSLDQAGEALKLADDAKCGKVVFLPHG